MGKASRRKQQTSRRKDPSQQRAPFVARPFEGLPGEAQWVAMREIVPAATATIRFTPPGADEEEPQGGAGAAGSGEPQEATVATVLPMAWPALHRADGQLLVALQGGATSGDASRDVAAALLQAYRSEPGQPVTTTPVATMATPRLQDLVDADAPFEIEVHEGFDFWVGDSDLDEQGRASLERANEAAVPTVKIEAVSSAYWCRIGERTYIRWILPQDEDAATMALARLQAAGEHTLGGDSTLLGAFRACGLLVPVLEVDPQTPPQELGPALAELEQRLEKALTVDEPLSPQERRAREGLVSRQVTLR